MPILSQTALVDPSQGYQMPPEFYNKLFTMHATIMIFFVIIPILTGAFGNFLIPLMIGADDMAFPEAEHVSATGSCGRRSILHRLLASSWRAARPRPAGPAIRSCRSHVGDPGLAERPDILADRRCLRRHLVDDGLGQLHHHDHHAARPRHDDVPHADDDLGDVHHRHPAGLRPAGADRGPGSCSCSTATVGTDFFMPGRLDRRQRSAGRRRRPAAALAAPVLVLFAPGRVHHDPAGDGHGLGHHRHASPASRCSATSRWSTRSPASPGWASSSGAITCSSRA